MNPDNRFQLLQLSIAKMTILLREVCAGKINDEQLSADLRDEADKLRIDLSIVREEFQKHRDRDNRLICKHKEMQQQLEDELVSSHQQRQLAECRAKIEAEHARTWQKRYELVDAERRVYKAENIILCQDSHHLTFPSKTGNADKQELMAISDVQTCPTCNEQQLVHVSHEQYQCLYCERTFSLEW